MCTYSYKSGKLKRVLAFTLPIHIWKGYKLQFQPCFVCDISSVEVTVFHCIISDLSWTIYGRTNWLFRTVTKSSISLRRKRTSSDSTNSLRKWNGCWRHGVAGTDRRLTRKSAEAGDRSQRFVTKTAPSFLMTMVPIGSTTDHVVWLEDFDKCGNAFFTKIWKKPPKSFKTKKGVGTHIALSFRYRWTVILEKTLV